MTKTFVAGPAKDRTFSRGERYSLAAGLSLTLALLGTPAALSAQEADAATPAQADYIADLKTCRQVAEASDRLACFDRTVGAMVAATESGEVRIVDREAVRETRRSLFGFTMPKGGVFGGDEDADDASMLESTITDVRRLRGDTYVITISEGSKWQMSNVPMRLRPPRAGDAVTLKRAALGSYFIRIAGQTGVKGRRIE